MADTAPWPQIAKSVHTRRDGQNASRRVSLTSVSITLGRYTREREGLTIAAVASRFGVGVASVVRWLKVPTPKATRDKPDTKIDMAALAQDVRDYPDAYHYERAARLGASRSGICDALKRLGITIKKTLAHPKASEVARIAFQERIAAHGAAGKPVVYIDESGFAQDMPRIYGYAPRGRRCHGKRDWYARGRINTIGGCIAHIRADRGQCRR